METRQGRLGPISGFTSEIDGKPYIVSTIPTQFRGLRVTGKELEGFDPQNELMEGFHPEFEFDVVFQASVYKLRPKRKKIFFINFTDFDMPIQEFHTLISDLLVRNPVEEMYGASCGEQYEQIRFAAVPAKMGFLRKKQHVFLIRRRGAERITDLLGESA